MKDLTTHDLSTDSPAYVPIGKLEIAPENPRNAQTIISEDVLILADNIEEIGLLTPLIGYAHGDTGAVFITAGGRRLRALRVLTERAENWSDATTVPVFVLSLSEAIEAGVAEQVTHRKLDALDEIKICALHPDMPIGDLSRRFGISCKAVRQRRAVLSLPEWILDQVLSGDLSPDHAFGLTYFVGADEEELADVIEWCKKRNPTLGDMRARYANRVTPWSKHPFNDLVTMAAYTKAGGKLEGDLFTEDYFIADPSIMRQCVKDALRAKVPEDHPGYGFYEIVEIPIWEARGGYDQYTPEPRDLTDEELQRVADMEAEQEAIQERMQEAGCEYRYSWPQEEKDAYDALEASMDAIAETAIWDSFTDAQRAALGVIICLTQSSYDVILNVLPQDDDERMIELGLMSPPKETSSADPSQPDAAPEPKGLSQALLTRIRQIKEHCARQSLIEEPDKVISDYLCYLSDMFDHTFQPTPLDDWDQARSFENVNSTTKFERAFELASSTPDAIKSMRPVDQRKALAIRLLMCHRPDAALPAAEIRKHFTPGEEWFSFYKKAELIEMAVDLTGNPPAEYLSWKKGDLVPLLTRLAPAHPEFLPKGF